VTPSTATTTPPTGSTGTATNTSQPPANGTGAH
jgi:hypothetical protein